LSLESRRRTLGRRILGALVLFVAACGPNSGKPSSIQLRRSRFSVTAETPIAISGVYLAYLADEATTGHGGTDMNGDGDKTDSVAALIDMATETETNLKVAASSIAWIGSHLYMVVDESLDGRDWNGDSDMDDVVLLHVFAGQPTRTPDFIDVISPVRGAVPMVAYKTNLFYSSARAPSGPGESNLYRISASAPLATFPVPTTDLSGPLSPRMLVADEGLIFLALDETAENRDLNGDGDALDRSVLALLDGSSTVSEIHNTRLASDPSYPVRARARGAHDWDVGFLVSEADQGATNLNDPSLFIPAWKPGQCIGSEDTDATDAVLHFLHFAPWSANPVQDPPVNTGLVGCRKIAIANGYIATITPEIGAGDPNGAEGSCDLNGDGDRLDYVVRWTAMTEPVSPLTLPGAVVGGGDIHALRDVPGGTHGLAELGSHFVVEVSESQDNIDINQDFANTFDYIGWLLPSGSGATYTPWKFVHGPHFDTLFGGSWMAETPDRSRLGIAIQEDSYGPFGFPGENLNAHDPPLPTDDTDITDSVPAVADINPAPVYLAFQKARVAVQKDSAGIVFTHDSVFSRVNEADDNHDWNLDHLLTGYVLVQTPLSLGTPFPISTLNSIPGRPAIEIEPNTANPLGAALIADEHYEGVVGTDFNGDGDSTDLVISYFLF
jgi:hypothetical protein